MSKLLLYPQLLLVQIALRVYGLRRLVRWLSLVPAGRPRSPLDSDRQAERLARQVEATARAGRMKDSCLPRSVLLWWLLRRRGVGARLCLGVEPQRGGLRAHAWVERRGRALGADRDTSARFAAFPGLSLRLRRRPAFERKSPPESSVSSR